MRGFLFCNYSVEPLRNVKYEVPQNAHCFGSRGYASWGRLPAHRVLARGQALIPLLPCIIRPANHNPDSLALAVSQKV